MTPAFLVSGPPATGKTTLGRALAARTHACLLDLDVLTGPLTAAVGPGDLDSPRFTGQIRAARYECVLATAEDNLRLGNPVVLIAPFTAERTDPAAWHRVRDRLAAAGGEPRLVWLWLTSDELLRRMRERAAGRDVAKLADPAAFLARHPLTPPVVEHLAVDATADVEKQLAGILSPTS